MKRMNGSKQSIRRNSKCSNASNNNNNSSCRAVNSNAIKSTVKSNSSVNANNNVDDAHNNNNNATNATKVNAEIICNNCQNYVMKSALQFTNCNHIICISCICVNLLKQTFSPIQSLNNNITNNTDNNIVTLTCPCLTGTCSIPLDKLLQLTEINETCLQHGEQITCPKCDVWASQYTYSKYCKSHSDCMITFFCKQCQLNICNICNEQLHSTHDVINLDEYARDIDELRMNTFTNKTFSEFDSHLKKVMNTFQTELNQEQSYTITKIDDIISQLTSIKTKYISLITSKQQAIHNMFRIIKYSYYYYYKTLFAKQNDYFNLQFLMQNKFELQNVSLQVDSDLNEQLTKCMNIVQHVNTILSSSSSLNDIQCKLNVRNLYSHLSAEMRGHSGYVFNVVQLNRQLIASCSDDKKIIIWNVNTTQKVKEIDHAHNSAVYSLCAIPSLNTFVSGSFGEMKIWSYDNTNDINEVKVIKSAHDNYITKLKTITYNIKQLLLVSCSEDFLIKLWDVYLSYKCVFVLKGHSDNIGNIISYSSNSDNSSHLQLVSCSSDRSLKFWDIPSCECISTIDNAHTSPIYAIILLRDGNTIVTGAYRDIKIWNTSQHKCDIVFSEKNTGVYDIVQVDDTKIASCSYKIINIWDINEKRYLYSLTAHDNFITCLLILSNGDNRLVSCSDDSSIKIWE